ncbi:hypothetical protein [Candidatus Palauibacter sp.]|uniref:hypothetical protein n=1 Tax=Candidatus Palauibacter sp. TaxID=3101350 RepID=UPI003B0228C0
MSGLYADPPARVVVFAFDEKGRIRALDVATGKVIREYKSPLCPENRHHYTRSLK